MANGSAKTKRYLIASDFDQTLSFNDSGLVLSELVGIPGFDERSSDSRNPISYNKALSSLIY